MINDEPHLVLSGSGKRGPMSFQCSLCGEPFALLKDRDPEQAVEELWGAFTKHLQNKHPETAGLSPA
jgi:hypothetical protein